MQINLYKVLNERNSDGCSKLEFVRSCWEDSILFIMKKNIYGLNFVKFLPIIDNLPLGHPKELIALTKSGDAYLFREIKNRNRSKKARPMSSKAKRKLKFKQQLEKHELMIRKLQASKAYAESRSHDEIKEITSLPKKSNVDLYRITP